MAQKSVHIPIFLIGESGIGKSDVVEQVAASLGIGCIDLRLATQEPGDLIGIPRDNGKGKMIWLMPEWFPEEGTKGILFLDELNRAPSQVRQCIFQLLRGRRMHMHRLPKGWIIVSAMNPDDSKSGYQVENLDIAMITRACNIKAEFSPDDWLQWAHKSGIDKGVIGFITAHKDLLHKLKESGPCPTPRTWEYVSTLIKDKVSEEANFSEIVTGLIGAEAATTFGIWMKQYYERPVSGLEILEDYELVREKILTQDRARNSNTATDLANLLSAYHQQQKKLTAKQKESVIDFTFDLGSNEKTKTKHNDVMVSFLKKLPPTFMSLEIIPENDNPKVDKLCKLFVEINKDAGIQTDK